ncbi:type II secretion system F family protein [Micromonospora sp. NPDC003944]
MARIGGPGMTGATMLVAALLLFAAALVAWPVQSIRARRRRVLAPGRRRGEVDPDDALVQWIRELGRTPNGPVDETGAVPPPGHPVGITDELGATAASSGRRTALGWSSRDVTRSPRWPGTAGGFTRPQGPTRPPMRRDPRRPTGTGPSEEATALPDAERHPAASAAAIMRGASGVDADGWSDARATAAADGHGGLGVGGRSAVSGVAVADGWAVTDCPDHRSVGRTDGTPGAPPPSVRISRSTTRVLPLVGLLGGGVGAVVAGPVAAVAMAGYGTLAVRGVFRWRVNRSAERDRRRALDQLSGLAADLRAGLPVPHAIEVAAVDGDGADRLRQLTSAAVRLADRTGAPLAELVERIEADARATDRGFAAAAAQAAGARATAWLLAALPIGGIGLGYGIGVDPMAVLLHHTVGGACAIAAVALQVVGLLWAERLGATPGRPG